jgi:hypothetical protein
MTTKNTHVTTELNPLAKDAVKDAINRIFAEFELVYHNQYNKAFPSEEKLNYAKRIWFSNLDHLRPEQIINAAHQAIRASEFLPTIRGLLKYLNGEQGLPDSYAAYIEACQTPSPKQDQHWSHAAVYLAGSASDWFFLANSQEQKALPVFKRHYEALCERVLNGEQLTMPEQLSIEKSTGTAMNNEQRKDNMKMLRDSLNI